MIYYLVKIKTYRTRRSDIMVLSVVIPVYNVAQYLEQCVDSVLASQETDYEILLVDDGSTDGVCPGICDRYAHANRTASG